MSMPRLGSSSRIDLGIRSTSILPMTTFCWLPPDSEPIGARRRPVLTCIVADGVVDHARARARREVNRPRDQPTMLASDRFCPTVIVCTRPSRCRSSGTNARPARDALGDAQPGDVADRSSRTLPAERRQAAGDALQQLGPPGAHQPVDADDLAAPAPRSDRRSTSRVPGADGVGDADVVDRQRHVAEGVAGRRRAEVEVLADHVADDPLEIDVAARRPSAVIAPSRSTTA